MRWYLESLSANLRSHTITSVQSNHDRVGTLGHIIYVVPWFLSELFSSSFFLRLFNFQVSLLLKDSFIDSFPSKDQPFIKVTSVLYFDG